MCHFGSRSVKRHMAISNDEQLVRYLTDLAGYLSREQKEQLVSVKLTTQKASRSSHPTSCERKKTCTGLKNLLKQSQNLGCKRKALYLTIQGCSSPICLRTYTAKFGRALAQFVRNNPESQAARNSAGVRMCLFVWGCGRGNTGDNG